MFVCDNNIINIKIINWNNMYLVCIQLFRIQTLYTNVCKLKFLNGFEVYNLF